MNNKRAQTTIGLFNLIMVTFVFVLILATFIFFFTTIDSAFQGNIIAGQVNLTQASDDTVGKVSDGFVNSSDILGIFFLFGVILSIILSGFMMRNKTSKLFFMIDFIIIIFAYILAVYVANAYETVLQALPFADLLAANLGNSSQFLLSLPIITAVTGFITMIVTYAGIPSTRNQAEVAGF